MTSREPTLSTLWAVNQTLFAWLWSTSILEFRAIPKGLPTIMSFQTKTRTRPQFKIEGRRYSPSGVISHTDLPAIQKLGHPDQTGNLGLRKTLSNGPCCSPPQAFLGLPRQRKHIFSFSCRRG